MTGTDNAGMANAGGPAAFAGASAPASSSAGLAGRAEMIRVYELGPLGISWGGGADSNTGRENAPVAPSGPRAGGVTEGGLGTGGVEGTGTGKIGGAGAAYGAGFGAGKGSFGAAGKVDDGRLDSTASGE